MANAADDSGSAAPGSRGLAADAHNCRSSLVGCARVEMHNPAEVSVSMSIARDPRIKLCLMSSAVEEDC